MNIRCSFKKLVEIKHLNPHPRNRNRHPPEQIERLAKILEYQGWRKPVTVSTRSGFVTSGHGRIEAAKLNKWTHVPVDFQDYESEEQEYADVIADNAAATWAELDLSGINLDLGDLGPDFDIDMLGLKNFTVDVAEKGGGGLTDTDDVPDPPAEPKTKRGELWLFDPYYECDSCKKQYPYEQGKQMTECSCG